MDNELVLTNSEAALAAYLRGVSSEYGCTGCAFPMYCHMCIANGGKYQPLDKSYLEEKGIVLSRKEFLSWNRARFAKRRK